MVEFEKSMKHKPGIFGYFILDLTFVYCTGIAFWCVMLYFIDGRKSISAPYIFENANVIMMPVVFGWTLLYLIHKAIKDSGDQN